MSKRALVTGSAGFVGRHLVPALELAGYNVVAVDLADAAQPRDAREFFAHAGPDWGHFDVVVHAAAHVGGRVDIERRAAFIAAYNLQLDGALFEWALRAEPDQIIYLSSSAAYPVHLQSHALGARLSEGDIDLADPELPDATYGWVKLTGERMAAEMHAANGQRVHVVRPFSGYGSDQDVSYPFGAFRARALAQADPFEVWGNGKQVRDWIHIDDVVGAIMALIDADLSPTTVNLCTGRGVSMVDLAHMFIRTTGRSSVYFPLITTNPDAPEGVQYRVGNPTRMQSIYVPKITILEGVKRACRR